MKYYLYLILTILILGSLMTYVQWTQDGHHQREVEGLRTKLQATTSLKRMATFRPLKDASRYPTLDVGQLTGTKSLICIYLRAHSTSEKTEILDWIEDTMGGTHAEHRPLYDQPFSEAIEELVTEGIIIKNNEHENIENIYSLNLQ